MARGQIDHGLSHIAADMASTVRFYVDCLDRSLTRHLEHETMRRVFQQAPHQGSTRQ